MTQCVLPLLAKSGHGPVFCRCSGEKPPPVWDAQSDREELSTFGGGLRNERKNPAPHTRQNRTLRSESAV